MTSRTLTDNELMSVVMFDIENVITRFRRLFNSHCSLFPCSYESKDYRKVQKLFDDIEGACLSVIYDAIHKKPFMFVFKDVQYAYVDCDAVVFDELNSLLYNMNMRTKRLEIQYLIFYDNRGMFAENTSDIGFDINQVIGEVMKHLKDECNKHLFRTITEKLDELDYLLCGF